MLAVSVRHALLFQPVGEKSLEVRRSVDVMLVLHDVMLYEIATN